MNFGAMRTRKAMSSHRWQEQETAYQEVALLRRLDHPNIVSYRDNFFMGDTLVIIMQYCEGGDLATYIKEHLNGPNK